VRMIWPRPDGTRPARSHGLLAAAGLRHPDLTAVLGISSSVSRTPHHQ
jgi:hypothetical protein